MEQRVPMSDGLGSTLGGASPQLSSEPLPAPAPLSQAELLSLALLGPGEHVHVGGSKMSPVPKSGNLQKLG